MATGERVLVGDYPKLILGGTTPASKIILRDPCESLSGLTIGGANIDANRSYNGSFGITESGNSYMLSSMGDGNTTYKGACGRIALSSGVDQFKLRVKMQHNSKGKNGNNKQQLRRMVHGIHTSACERLLGRRRRQRHPFRPYEHRTGSCDGTPYMGILYEYGVCGQNIGLFA